ncbi:PREDICTED: ribosomal RNA-processing protein 7 homolog A [Vollenhovia emeryi]|uniref:ribosomal RNA-processing protein 7 homolog A n=1 Tax=Vollenhovia emeryi TaxID=411798 RepID=UPI0005F4BDB9|nr:PREDICTED: ribosomal RNA-processing protein 7 homolog A [Vollenhovia emeryi]XP_011865991.1 PREDICTED: ribosomal RNA-processing protein 7 homolog A [Vollenhovia emeryi]
MVTKAQNASRSYKTLWIRFAEDSSDKHQLFIKEHSAKKEEPEYPRNRTLFVRNVPPYATADCLRHAFASLCGDVQSVIFTTEKGFKTGHIVFKTESSLNKALKLSTDCVISLSGDACVTGLEKWCAEYNATVQYDEKLIKANIEEYIASYDKRIKDRLEQAKAEDDDDDGWITVTGAKKRGEFAPTRKESTISKVKGKEERKKKQLLNFYTFQIREAKKQNLAELREKFELDKKRLQELKQKRTFKPF